MRTIELFVAVDLTEAVIVDVSLSKAESDEWVEEWRDGDDSELNIERVVITIPDQWNPGHPKHDRPVYVCYEITNEYAKEDRYYIVGYYSQGLNRWIPDVLTEGTVLGWTELPVFMPVEEEE